MENEKGLKKSIWIRLVEFHVRHSLVLLVLITLGSIFFMYHTYAHLKIHTDFFDLYPPNHPYIKLYKEYRKMFGSANVINVILEVKNGTVYNPETLAKVDRMTRRLLDTKGSNAMQIISLTHPKLKDVQVKSGIIMVRPLSWPNLPHNELESELFRKKVYTNEGIRGLYVSPDDKATLITAGFWEEGVDLKNLYSEMMELKKTESDANHNVYITGYPMLYAYIHHYSNQLITVLVLTTLVLTILLLMYFRSFLGVFVPLISGVLSAIWGLGFASLMGFHIDPLILVVPLLLSARALSHSVQSMDRYHEEYARIGDKRQAIIFAYGHLYKPAIFSIVCDGLGVLTIAVASIPLMRNLALFSSFWILSIYVSSVVLHPVLVALLPAPRQKHLKTEEIKNLDEDAVEKIREINRRPADRIYMTVCHGLIFLTQSWRKWVAMGVVVLIIIGGGTYARKLKVGDTSAGKAIFYKDHPYNVAADKLDKNFIGSDQLVVIAEGKQKGACKNAEVLSQLEDLQIFTMGLSHVGGSLTIANVLKRLYQMFHEGDPKWSMIPESQRDLSEIFFLFEANTAPGEMDRFISTPDYDNATITTFFRGYSNKTIKDAIAGIKGYIESHPSDKVNYRLAGGMMGILAAVNEEVEWSYWVNLALIFLMTGVVCTVAFRSFLTAIILITPLAVSQVLSELLMLVAGMDLNINSLPVAAVGVGIGVDYGIYVMSRMGEEYTRTKDYARAQYLAITSTGKAVVFTATTLVAGVIFWGFSGFKFQAEMGFLLAFLMVANMIGSLAILPAMVSIFGPDRILLKYKA